MTFKIESGVPAPAPRFIPKRKRKYPFDQMKINDSFFVPNGKVNTISVSVAQFHQKNKPKRLTCRTVEGGVRVWRVK